MSWNRENREKINRQRREWCAANPEAIREIQRRTHLKRTYGITPEEYEEKLVEQNGRCAICDRKHKNGEKAFHVDHNHTTGQIRGLLCFKCNVLVGRLEHPMRAVAETYLQRWREV